jgi:Uma2 family endonuclease
MTSITQTFVHPSSKIPSVRKPKTVEEFLAWKPRDGFKYEWVNGNILKLTKMITPEQFHIVKNLTRLFSTTDSYKTGAELMPEVKTLTINEQVRVPDIAYFTAQQQVEMANGGAPVPLFAIEIISPNDILEKVDLKLEEYFKAGVQVLWHILPTLEKVYIYTSPLQVTVCKDTIICSAESVIPGFSLAAKAIFKKP